MSTISRAFQITVVAKRRLQGRAVPGGFPTGIAVSDEFMDREDPSPGDYFVQYADGTEEVLTQAEYEAIVSPGPPPGPANPFEELAIFQFVDLNGNPAGGNTYGPGISIGWQNGAVAEDGTGRNGAAIEHVLEAARQRIKFTIDAGGGGAEYVIAFDKVSEAIAALTPDA